MPEASRYQEGKLNDQYGNPAGQPVVAEAGEDLKAGDAVMVGRDGRLYRSFATIADDEQRQMERNASQQRERAGQLKL